MAGRSGGGAAGQWAARRGSQRRRSRIGMISFETSTAATLHEPTSYHDGAVDAFIEWTEF